MLIAPYGFDGTKWDPSRDKLLPANYSADDIGGKAVCKVALRQRLGFSGHSSAIVHVLYTFIIYPKDFFPYFMTNSLSDLFTVYDLKS